MRSEPRQVIRLAAVSPVETLAALRTLIDRIDTLLREQEQRRTARTIPLPENATEPQTPADQRVPTGSRAAADEDTEHTLDEVREAVRLTDEFLTALGQDLRSSITVIKGRAQLLQRQARQTDPPDEALLAGLAAIEKAVETLASRIDELRL